MIKVSVIVLCYNAELTIQKCLDSLIHQTLDNVEFIIVNDGSTDNSLNIIKSKVTEFINGSQVRIINNTHNKGQAYCRIQGIKTAVGEYVIACDSDDYIQPQMLELLYHKAKTENYDIVSCDFYRIINGIRVIDMQPQSHDPIEFIKLILLAKKWGGVWNHMIRRELFRDIKAPVANIMEDTNILIQCLIKAKTVTNISEPLYNYVIRKNSSTSSQNLKNQAIEMNLNILEIEKIIREHQLSTLYDYIEYRKFFNKRWINPTILSITDCIYWINFNSDINYKILLNRHISVHDKITSILIFLRIYPFIKRFINYIIKGKNC